MMAPDPIFYGGRVLVVSGQMAGPIQLCYECEVVAVRWCLRHTGGPPGLLHALGPVNSKSHRFLTLFANTKGS